MKNYLTMLLTTLSIIISHAQEFGFYGNIAMANQHVTYFSPNAFFTNHFGFEYYSNKNKLINYTIGTTFEKKGYNFLNSSGVEGQLRLKYISIKGLVQVGNNKFYAQLGPYLGYAYNIENIFNGIVDEYYKDEMRRLEIGLSTSLHQYLFSYKSISGYIRGEVNYALSNEYSGDFIDFDVYNRNYTYGLGLCLRWSYKD